MRSFSLRIKLMGLMMLAFLPLVVLEVNTAAEQKQHAAQTARDEALRLSGLIASNQQALIDSVRQLLTAMTQIDGVQKQSSKDSQALFEQLLKDNPLFSIVAALDAEGNVFCSAPKEMKPTNLMDRAFFQKAMASRAFVMGDFAVGRISRKPTIHLALPVINQERQVTGVVYVGLDLRKMSELGTLAPMPRASSIAMVGDDDIFLIRYPDPDHWIGKRAPKAMPRELNGGTAEFTGADGVKRIYAINRLDAPGGGHLFIMVGISKDQAYAPFLRQMRQQLVTIGAVAFLALAAAWALGSGAIVHPAKHLEGVARALSAGRLDVRSKLRGGEFGEIGMAFNQMAETLSRRIAELNEAQNGLRRAHDELEIRVEKRTEELRQAQERLVDAIENIDAGFVMFSPDERLVICNQTFRTMFGLCADIIQPGVHFDEIIHEFVRRGGRVQGQESMEAWARERIALFQKAEGTQFDQKIGSRWYRVSDHRMRDGGVVSLRTDVTSLKEIQEELHRSNQELEQFAYMVSHDLQEPLRMVASYNQLLARRYKDQLDANAHEFIGYAVDGALRMQGFIKDLLQYSRVGTHGHPFERLQTGEILRHALENLRLVIEEKNARIVCGPLPELDADPLQLGQLFQNLISNALKFTGTEPLQIEINAVRRDQDWEFSVRDNGIGIPSQDAERIFVIFQRLHTRQEYEGSGIGLAICKRIVERHRGRIWVESQPGSGATFYFTLPEHHEEIP